MRKPAPEAPPVAPAPKSPGFFARWQGLWALVASLTLFMAAPKILEYCFPEDGALRPGSYLHCLILGVAIFFMGIFLAWLVIQFDFKSFDRRLDAGDISTWLEDLGRDPTVPTTHKICTLLAPFIFVLLWLGFSLWLAVSLVK